MRVALYARVSTDEQAERFGLSSQITELGAWATARGYTIPEGVMFIDDGYSGAEWSGWRLTACAPPPGPASSTSCWSTIRTGCRESSRTSSCSTRSSSGPACGSSS